MLFRSLDSNSPVSIANDPEISGLLTQTTGNVSVLRGDSERAYKSIIKTTIKPGSQTAQSIGPFAITPTNSLNIIKNILKVGYVKIFGSGSGFGIFITTFISILVFMFGLFLYKTLRGLPD